MKRNTARHLVGALLLSATLGFPGLAAAEPAGPARILAAAAELFQDVWDWDLVGVFLADETTSSAGTGPTGSTSGGGAMDPNGNPKPKPAPPPNP